MSSALPCCAMVNLRFCGSEAFGSLATAAARPEREIHHRTLKPTRRDCGTRLRDPDGSLSKLDNRPSPPDHSTSTRKP